MNKDINTYTLNFKGYWVKPHIETVPTTPGVFTVYECEYDSEGVVLKELIFIGKSENLHDSIENLDEHAFSKNSKLCYTVAETDLSNIDAVENALVFAQKPRLNKEGKDDFKYSTPITLSLEGRCRLMNYTNFEIK